MFTYFEQLPIDEVEAALERASAASANTPQTPPAPSLAPAQKAIAAIPYKSKNISRKGRQ